MDLFDLFDLFAKISIDLSDFDRGLSEASNKFNTFSSNIQKIGEKVSNVGGTLTKSVTIPLAGAGTVAGKMYLGFEDAIAKVNTIADTSQVPIEGLQKAILALSNQTGISSNEIANNVYDAISAGQKTGDAVGFVEKSTKLAKAGFADAGNALDILTTIMNAYGLEADKVSDVSDMLIQTQNLGKTTVGELASAMGKVIPTAKAQGVELDDLSGAYAVMTSNGIATAETTTYLNSMLNELGKQGTSASKAFSAGTEHIKAGGLTMKEAMDSGWELTDVLSILSEQASLTGTSISNMFGSAEAGKAASVLWDNAQKLNEAVYSMRESSGATEIAFEKLQTKSVIVGKAINQLKNTAIDLGGTLMDVLAPMIESASEKIASFTEWFAGLDEGTKRFIVTAGLAAAAIGPILVGVGNVVSAIGTIGGAVSNVVGLVSAGIGNIMGLGSKLMGGIKLLFGLIAANPVVAIITGIIAAVVLLYTKCEWFRDAVHAVIDAVAGFFKNAWEAIQAAWSAAGEFFGGIVNSIKSAFDGIGEFLGGLFTAAWELVRGAWDVAVGFFTEIGSGIQAVFEAVTSFLGEAFSAAWSAITAVWDAAVGFFSAIWDGVSGAAETAAGVVGDVLSAAWDAITSVWDGAVSFFGGIWDGIKGVFSDVWSHFLDIGSNIVNGIKDGIAGAWDAFMGWLDSKVGGIVNGVKSMLGIHSPSTVFAGIGENMALGLAEGWGDQYSSIKRQIENGMNFGTATVGLNVSGRSRGGTYGSSNDQPAARGGDTFNFYSPKALDPVSAAREMKKAKQQMALGYV